VIDILAEASTGVVACAIGGGAAGTAVIGWAVKSVLDHIKNPNIHVSEKNGYVTDKNCELRSKNIEDKVDGLKKQVIQQGKDIHKKLDKQDGNFKEIFRILREQAK